MQCATDCDSEDLCCVQCCILLFTVTSVQLLQTVTGKSFAVCSVVYCCLLLHLCSVPVTVAVKNSAVCSVVYFCILLYLCSVPVNVTVKSCAVCSNSGAL